MTARLTCFISGPPDLTLEQFNQHYVLRFAALIDQGYSFVLGDHTHGCDLLAQRQLHHIKYRHVTVYHLFGAPALNLGRWRTRGRYGLHERRDAAMTKASSCDLLWVPPGRERSAAGRNQQRRLERDAEIGLGHGRVAPAELEQPAPLADPAPTEPVAP